MPEPEKRNIIWVCVDGFRVDGLNICGCERAKQGFFDELFPTGAFFDECITSAMHTIGSTHSFMSSLPASTVRMHTQTANCLLDPHPQTVYLADILREQGYTTFRWDDMGTYSCQPKFGFDHFEGGYWCLGETPHNNFDAPRRQAFAKRFKETAGLKFAYMHLDYLHEYGGESAKVWTTEKYIHYQWEVADEVRRLLSQMGYGEDDLLVINTDHGITLDRDWWKTETEEGSLFHEGRIRTFAFFGGRNVPAVHSTDMVRTTDIAPTLLELVGVSEGLGLGTSLVPRMHGADCEPLVARVEWTPSPEHKHVIGGTCPDTYFALCLRSKEWKYIVENDGSVQLLRLGHDGNAVSDEELASARAYFDEVYRYTVHELPDNPDEIYDMTGQPLRRADLKPEVSVIMPVDRRTESLRDALLTIRCQVPELEIIMPDGDASGRVRELLAEYDEDPRITRLDMAGKPLHELLSAGLDVASAPYVALVSQYYRYTENYLYDLMNLIRSSDSRQFAYGNVYEFFNDPRTDYRYTGPSTFYIKGSQDMGGSGTHRNVGGFNAQRLARSNYIGECAVFATELCREAGGFGPGSDPVRDAWQRMAALTRFQHVKRPYIISPRPVSRPVLGFNEKEAFKDVSLILHAPDVSPETVRWLSSFAAFAENGNLSVEMLVCAEESKLPQLTNGHPFMGVSLPEGADMATRMNAAVRAALGKNIMHCMPGETVDHASLVALCNGLKNNPHAPAAMASLSICSDGAQVGALPAASHQVRDFWTHRFSLSGVLYRSSMHEDAGMFEEYAGNLAEWDWMLRLVEYAPMAPVPEADMKTHRAPEPYRKDDPQVRAMFRQAAMRMNGCVDLALLYRDVFAQHPAGEALNGIAAHFLDLYRQCPVLKRLKAPLASVDQGKFNPAHRLRNTVMDEFVRSSLAQAKA